MMETTKHTCTVSNNVEYLFICLFATMYLLCPLKKIGMVTSSLWSFGLLVYFEYKPFIRQVLQIFSPACGLPFYSLNSIFCRAEVCFNKVQLIIFILSQILLLLLYLVIHCQTFQIFSQFVFQKFYIVFFCVYDHLELIFVKSIRSVFTLIFLCCIFAYGHPVIPIPLLKRPSFLHWIAFSP